MRIQRAISGKLDGPKLTVCHLPAKIVDRAANGLGWVSVICATTSIVLTAIQYAFQLEFAAAWGHPALKIVSWAGLLVSLGFLAVQRLGWLTKHQLLDLGVLYQIAIAFMVGVFEGAAYEKPDAMVVGISGIGIWMMLCGRLMPKTPAKSAVTAALCILMWPLGYAFDLRIFGYTPMPIARLMAWVLPLVVVGIWMYVLNNRTLALYFQEQRAEEMGSYTLTTLIGSGGMGEVWRARHRSLARDAAVKLIRPEMLHSSTGREEQILRKRFEREAQATAMLRCPHTVALYDVGQAKGGAFYYAMQLIDGIALESLVDRFGPLNESRVIHILEQVAESLEEAHRMGLVHRDIKPRNIILGKTGLRYDFTKVLDFGLVKKLDPDPERTATTMNDVTAGTPAYLSPEAALGSPKIDSRADLYSLGCTAYFLLTGCTVFVASSPTGYAITHVQTPPPPMAERCEAPPTVELEALIMELLKKDPADRIQSAQDLSRRLRRLNSVPRWSPEDAEQWWRTNLPKGAAWDVSDPQHATPNTVGQSA